MKKLGGLLIIVTYMISVVYCTLEAPIDEPVNIIIEIEETKIMNDFIVKPFMEFPAYFVQGNRVSGIPTDCKTMSDMMPVVPKVDKDDIDDLETIFNTFFVQDRKVYFIISQVFPATVEGEEPETVTKYCTLKDGEVVYLTEAKFPEMPQPERVTGTTENYTVDIGQYNGDPISIASRDYPESFIMIDGFIAIEGGLLIHTPTGRGSSRPAGLLFWPEGLRTMNHWKEPGRFWK